MYGMIIATYKKNRISNKRASPFSFMLSRVISGISAVVFPFFIYVYFFNKSLDENFYVYTKNTDYITYIVLGAAINVLGVATLMNVGRALITELREGTLETFLLSPASRKGYLIGCFVEQLGRSLVEFGIVLVTGLLLGATLSRLISVQAILVIFLSIFGFFSMSLVLSSIMLYTRDTYISQNTLFILITLICGIAFPIQYLPVWVQGISHIFPTTAAVSLFRNVVILNQGLLANINLILEIIALSAIYMFVGLLCYGKIEKNLIENIFG